MDSHTSDPFRDAALRSDPSDLRYERPPASVHRTETMRSETVVSDRGIPAYAEPARVVKDHHRFSLGATFLGWTVAAFFTFVFTLAIAGFAGSSLADGQVDLNNLALGTMAGYLLATFAAYLIGGYAAGRIALWDGVKHGMLTVGWAVLFAAIAVVLGTTLASQFDLQAYVPIDITALTTTSIVAIVLTLVAMLAGSGLGGMMGERYHDRVHGIDSRRRAGRERGRPL